MGTGNDERKREEGIRGSKNLATICGSNRYLQQKSSLPIPQRTNWFEYKTGCKPTKQDEKEILEDLIVAAINDAKEKGEAAAQEEMKNLTGGLPLPPGMKLPF